jgi:hypothetical protein
MRKVVVRTSMRRPYRKANRPSHRSEAARRRAIPESTRVSTPVTSNGMPRPRLAKSTISIRRTSPGLTCRRAEDRAMLMEH